MQKCVILLISIFVITSTGISADTIYSKSDILTFDKYITTVAENTNSKTQDLIISTAKFFLNKPYVAATLDKGDPEKLVVNFSELDCTTFVETCMALYSTVHSQDTSFSMYKSRLVAMRYRGGVIDGYCSRLHYSSDWIYENQKRGFWKDISAELHGVCISKPVNYMSTHPQVYKQLKYSEENISQIADIERNINARGNYIVIPTEKIPIVRELIQNGDVILFATAIAGLDYSHMGIAYWVNGNLHFIHASSAAKRVVIESKTLVDYCKNSRNCTGISVLRVN